MVRYGFASCLAGGLVLVSVASGSVHATQTKASSSLIAILERGSTTMAPDGTFKGRFVLTQAGVVIKDRGTTVIRPNEGTVKIVGGQQQVPVSGVDTLTGKQGSLTLSFRGVSIIVKQIDDLKSSFDNERGTWKIGQATGAYKGWKGGGNWALVATPAGNNIEWDGYVTSP